MLIQQEFKCKHVAQATIPAYSRELRIKLNTNPQTVLMLCYTPTEQGVTHENN